MKYIISLVLLQFVGWHSAMAQSDIEMTDSISTGWGDDIGGLLPSMPTEPVTSLILSQTSIS